jgi:hypothetical protein
LVYPLDQEVTHLLQHELIFSVKHLHSFDLLLYLLQHELVIQLEHLHPFYLLPY